MVRNVLVHGDNLIWLAVDPGKTTGWVLFQPTLDEEQLTGYGIRVLGWGEDDDQIRFCNRVWSMSSQPRAETKRGLDGIVIEGWQNRPGVQDFRPEALEILGFCRWVMADDQERFAIQLVAHATSFGTDAKIRSYRANRTAPNNVGKGGQGHAVKALQHAILFVNTRWSPEPRP